MIVAHVKHWHRSRSLNSRYLEERISRDREIQRTKKSIEGFMDLRLSFIPVVTVVAVDPGAVVVVVVAER